MTESERIEKYRAWARNIAREFDSCIEIFEELQDMSVKYGDGKRWTTIEFLLKSLIHTRYSDRAVMLTYRLFFTQGKMKALIDFQRELDEN